MRLFRHVAAGLVVLLGVTLAAPPAAAAPDDPVRPPAPAAVYDGGAGVAAAQRDRILGREWRGSVDRAWVVSGDAAGLHVLVADARDGYAWRTAATLFEPGFDADQWIGNACVTGSGRRLAVAYAPRTFTNSGALFSRGAFTAVVDLQTGRVARLPVLATLAYYSPGCGTGETVVYTQAAGDDAARTRLVTVDAVRGRAVSRPVVLDGQVTSAVPVGSAIVAADRHRLVRITGDGRRTTLARTRAVPFQVVAARDGVTYLDRAGDEAFVEHVAEPPSKGEAKPRTLAKGRLTDLDLTRDAAGQAYVTGTTRWQGGGAVVLGAPKGSSVSTRGGAVLTSVIWSGRADPRAAVGEQRFRRPVEVRMRMRATGQEVTFTVQPAGTGTPATAAGTAAKTAPQKAATAAAGSPTNPVEDERTCSVPRNDPRNQAMQPKPRQVEWAVDQAVRNVLTVQREANWKNVGMTAYTPQGLFPPLALVGGGSVPAQVVLGIAAQESNLWQATGRALPGVTANPLIGNFYGRDIYNDTSADDWDIHWEEADCGYGVMQVTDGMRRDDQDYQRQRAIALDFAANVAAGLQILQSKWNQTRSAGLTINNGDPRYLENWFFALWAYNSGFHPDRGDGTPWGVGWLNNPANPNYPANRDPFLERTMADAARPQYWPYQEKVLGFAGHPIELPEAPNVVVAAFRPAVWNGGAVQGPINRSNVKPPVNLFCDASNNCVPGAKIQPDDPDVAGEPAGPCANKNAAGKYDLRCWYNRAATWKPDCTQTCGYELLRFDPGYAYQADGTSYAPRCDATGLPASALIVDDVPDSVPSIRPNCARFWGNAGRFDLTFAADSTGHYPSKVDFHQFGAGFGGHFYSSFTRGPSHPHEAKLKVSGTWRLANSLNGWVRIKVFVPDTGAWTRQARYDIDLGDGRRRYRVVNQAWQAHTWVDLGVFPVNGTPSVTLTTRTADGVGSDTVVFDAVAFIPAPKPSAVYVALGDSYSSGEGLKPYLPNTDYKRASDLGPTNACHRSANHAYPSLVKSPGHTKTIAQEAAENTASFAFLACSGAMTTNITTDAYNDPPTADDLAGHTDWGPVGDFGYPYSFNGEVPQVDQGYLDEETTLVTLTVGGNDARFAEVIRSCVAALDFCYTDTHKLTRTDGPVDPEPLRVYEKKLIRHWLAKHLKAAYRAVHERAPNAKIIVLGYPQLFGDRPHDNTCVGLNHNELLFLNTLADLLNTVIAHAVADIHDEGVDIRFVNVTQRWRDSHSNWACDNWTDPWVNGGIISCDSGIGRETPCRASYHPTLTGQAQLADVVNLQLRGVSSAAAVQQRILAYVATRTPDPNDSSGGQRWIVSPVQALEIAERCLDLTRVGGVLGDPCMTEPMLAVTTRDSGGAARNDAEAIERLPWWVHLNYTSSELREEWVLPRDWFVQRSWRPNACADTPKNQGDQCDEYPFFSSEFGGAFDPIDGYDSESSSRLRWVPEPENQAEGRQLGAMYTACSVKTSVYSSVGSLMVLGDPYLTIPVVAGDPVSKPWTFYVC
ncbi:transglycosylase SLT domain-containing protein [Micromonospora sp. CPCC 205371]|nr:transglycosylase SLT domain-containing protein [Micromonospora sp. CPCC 205371]